MDTSRMTAGQIQHYYNKKRYAQQEEQEQIKQDQIRERQQTNNGSPNELRDLLKSDFHKTVTTTLSNNRKKEHIQRNLNQTIDNLSNHKLNIFAKQFDDDKI